MHGYEADGHIPQGHGAAGHERGARMHVVIGGVGERGHRPQAVAIHPIGRGDLSIRQVCADAGVIQRGHELIGRLLQRQHLNALVAHRIHNRLRIGLPLVHIRRHHTGIPVGRIRLSGGHRGGSLRRQLDLRHEERILPPDLQADAGHSHQRHNPTARNQREQQRQHRRDDEPRRRRHNHRHIRQRLQLFGQRPRHHADHRNQRAQPRQDAQHGRTAAALRFRATCGCGIGHNSSP